MHIVFTAIVFRFFYHEHLCVVHVSNSIKLARLLFVLCCFFCTFFDLIHTLNIGNQLKYVNDRR